MKCTVYVFFEDIYWTSEVCVDFGMWCGISRKLSLVLKPEHREYLADGWTVTLNTPGAVLHSQLLLWGVCVQGSERNDEN